MGKLALTRALRELDDTQLRELVRELYDSRPADVRRWLDFWLDPDVDALTTRTNAAIDKELARRWHGRPVARISRIKTALKDFESYNPGPEYAAALRVLTLQKLLDLIAGHWVKEALVNSTVRLYSETLRYVDTHELTSRYLPTLLAQADDLSSTSYRTRDLRAMLHDAIENIVGPR